MILLITEHRQVSINTMSDDEYAYGDIDELTALLDDEDEKDPYQDDVPTCATKKYTYNPSLEDLSSKSQLSSQKPAESTSDHQRSTQVASSGQVSSQGQGSMPGQTQSSCEDDVSDEAKSKEELMGNLYFYFRVLHLKAGSNFIKLLKQKKWLSTITFCYQNKVPSQTTISYAQFVNGILLISASA